MSSYAPILVSSRTIWVAVSGRTESTSEGEQARNEGEMARYEGEQRIQREETPIITTSRNATQLAELQTMP